MPRRFPPVARALAELLGAEIVTPQRTGTYTPEDFTGLLPYVRVTRTGGPSNHLDDKAEVDVDVFAADATAAQDLAEDIRQYLINAPRRSGARIFDRITCEIGPAEVAPWAPQIKRVNAAYRVVSRRYDAP